MGHGSPVKELTLDLILFKGCLALSLFPSLSLSLPVCLSILVYRSTNLERNSSSRMRKREIRRLLEDWWDMAALEKN